jgi:hypothetical protein
VLDQYQSYLSAGTSFSRLTATTGATAATVYAVFGEDTRPLLPMVDTDLIFCDTPYLLKYFHSVRFGGRGKLYVRALADGTEVARGWVTLSEDPNQANIFHFPRGTAGYGIRLQLVGIASWRYYEIEWDPVGVLA